MRLKVRKTTLLVLIAMAIGLLLTLTVPAEAQEVITEEEAAERFEQNPESLVAGLEANTTVVVPTPGDHECRFAILCKKVLNENGERVSGALVRVEAFYTKNGERQNVKIAVLKLPLTWRINVAEGTTGWSGIVCFLFIWNSNPYPSIPVTITVSKEGYQTKIDTVTIPGATGCYCYSFFTCITNRLIPEVPEFSLTTPLVMSIGTATYLLMQRRRKKV